MIPGVIGQRRRGAVGGGGGGPVLPDWLPEGAVAHLDWVNGNYWAGGAEWADTDLLGGDYNPAAIAVRGLFMQLGTDMYGPTAIGALFTDLVNYLQAGATLAIDVDAADAPADFPNGTIIYFFDDADPDLANEFLEVKPSTSPRSIFMGDSQTLGFTGSSPNVFTTAGASLQVAAFTINGPVAGPLFRYALSVNGGTEQSTDKSYNASYLVPATIRLFAVQEWNYGMQDVYVRRLTLFPAAADVSVYSVPYFPPVTPDGTFADVVFLCHWNGVDAATAATDQSGSAHTITFAGAAELDTAEKRFGSASLLLPSTGSKISCANSADFQFGSGPFAIEGSVYFAGTPADATVSISFGLGSGEVSWEIEFSPVLLQDTAMVFRWSLDGTTIKTITAFDIIPPNGQHDWIVERDTNNVIRMSVDGVVVGLAVEPGSLHASSEDFIIEVQSSTTNVWVDETRITKGAFWYGPDPTVPAGEFPNS